ncbi:MAG: glucose-6-phosphate isomerase, partial [Burkholderiales bacterium]
LKTLSESPAPHLRELLKQQGRSGQMQASGSGITLDYSRQRVTDAVLQQLLALAQESQVMAQAQAMFSGNPINRTEQRAVLHVALRGSHVPNPPWGEAISRQVADELSRMCRFAEQVRDGQLKGFAGDAITDVVNLGIGGSDLGPRMTTEALGHLTRDSFANTVRVHYVSNVDAWSLYATLATLDPARTAFVVQSKTFTTQETLTLAVSAQRWLRDAGCPADQLHQHLIAVTANPRLSAAQGYTTEHTFGFWDWVGGRYSVWSAIGLPLAISIGASAFQDMLLGARAMDEHFMSAPAQENLPLLMALFGIWNRNFLGASTHNIAPYASSLGKFAAFLQQMEMESNGKRTHLDGSPVEVATAPVLWGGLGIDGQHAYFQLIHQGQHLVPMDFIGLRSEHSPLPLAAEHHRIVLLNMQAQVQALALGRTPEETVLELRASGLAEAEVQALAPHRSYAGNVPSSNLWLEALTPHSLGALIALYEHKVFCQAAIWGINAYDQWGVELGKTMAKEIEAAQAAALKGEADV